MWSSIRKFQESILFAIQALVVNRLRTFLSLMGVTIGIFSIISVFTLVDSLENEIRSSIQELGDNVVYIQKWPWEFGNEYRWWDYVNRPQPSLQEYLEVDERSELASAVGYSVSFRNTVKHGENSIERQSFQAITAGYDQVRSFSLQNGRYFSNQELNSGRAVCVIGDYVAYVLFGNRNPVGKTIKIGGRKTMVVGVLEKEGESMFGESVDEIILVPVNYARVMIDLRSRYRSPQLYVKAKDGVSIAALKDELTVIMRSLRRLKPKSDSNFALNEMSILSRGFDEFFSFLNMVGLIIGGFSILVGGFGIANIMFVSVKERTNIIGIQKALGAKRFFILTQFLAEAVMLCLIGGGVGLFLIFLIGLASSSLMDFQLALSAENMMLGFGISATIGLISGFVPALSASRLDPVEAMRK
jgi:putative ABC transport system permease protein